MVAAHNLETEPTEPQRHPHAEALKIAMLIKAWLHPHVERIEIGGSIRRGAETVKDIEFIIIPGPSYMAFTDDLVERGVLAVRHGWGDKSRFATHVKSGIGIDLFTATPENWGYIYWLRTGPGDVNTRLMTWLKRNNAPVRARGGVWWHGDHRLVIPDEAAMHQLLGIPYIAPENRTVQAYAQHLNNPRRRWPDFSQFYASDTAAQGEIVAAASGSRSAPFTDEQMRGMAAYEAGMYMQFYDERFEAGALSVTEERISRAVNAAYRSGLSGLIQKANEWAGRWRSSHKFRRGENMLNIDTEGKLGLTVDDFVGYQIAVLGVTGSGKSNTTAVLIEETAPYIPFIIFDDEDEYWSLTEKFDALIVGRTEHAMIDVPVEQAAALAEFVYRRGISVILSLNRHLKQDKLEFLYEFFTGLWRCADAAAAPERRPYMIVLEESHRVIPQRGGVQVKEVFEMYASAGRKRGLSLIMSSQRSAKIDKDALTSAQLYFLHKVVHHADMNVYRAIVPGMKPQEVEEAVNRLDKGEALVIWRNKPITVRVRRRETFHPGATPTLDSVASVNPELRKMDAALLAELRTSLAVRPAESRDPFPQQDDAQARIAALEAEVARLTAELDAAQNAAAGDEYRAALIRVREIVNGVLKNNGLSDAVAHDLRLAVAQADVVGLEDAPSAPGWDGRSEAAIKRAQGRQRNAFNKLISEVRLLRSWQVSALVYLAEVEPGGEWFTEKELAYRLGYSISTLKGRMSRLVKMGLLESQQGVEGLEFRSRLRAAFGERYPDLEPDGLVQEFISIFLVAE